MSEEKVDGSHQGNDAYQGTEKRCKNRDQVRIRIPYFHLFARWLWVSSREMGLRFVAYGPPLILFATMVFWIYNREFMGVPRSQEGATSSQSNAVPQNGLDLRYKVSFSAVGLLATMAALSLSTARVEESEKKKRAFVLSGQRLFHAALAFGFATTLEFVLFEFANYLRNLDPDVWRECCRMGLAVLALLIMLPAYVYAAKSTLEGLDHLHRTLYQDHEGLLPKQLETRPPRAIL